jgi:hypothetical protein
LIDDFKQSVLILHCFLFRLQLNLGIQLQKKKKFINSKNKILIKRLKNFIYLLIPIECNNLNVRILNFVILFRKNNCVTNLTAFFEKKIKKS